MRYVTRQLTLGPLPVQVAAAEEVAEPYSNQPEYHIFKIHSKSVKYIDSIYYNLFHNLSHSKSLINVYQCTHISRMKRASLSVHMHQYGQVSDDMTIYQCVISRTSPINSNHTITYQYQSNSFNMFTEFQWYSVLFKLIPALHLPWCQQNWWVRAVVPILDRFWSLRFALMRKNIETHVFTIVYHCLPSLKMVNQEILWASTH